jgi:Cys-tRNA synthase (O-phospho-L-seryl-tRNA:Cys-tRNA synthase)
MIKIEVTDENAKEVLKRKQDGENICPVCVKQALDEVMKKILVAPTEG